jgi:integrase
MPRYISHTKDHLQKRSNLYYAVCPVPKSIRHLYGSKVRLVQSLKTDSVAVAKRRAAVLVSAWKGEFARVKNEGDDAAFFRNMPEGPAKQAAIALAVENLASATYQSYAGGDVSAEDRQEAEAEAEAEATNFYKRATGQITATTAYVDAYLDRQSTSDKTKAMAKSDIEGFAQAFPTVQDVSYEGVQRWVDNLGVAPATVRRTLSSIRGYWKYLQRPDVKAAAKDNNPLANLDLPKAKGNGATKKRKPFSTKDVLKLVVASGLTDPELKDLIWVGMWTGARIEEICALKTKDVHLSASVPYFAVLDAKTQAGLREVPIHKRLMAVMKSLVKDSKDGYVFSGLPVDKYGDRSPAIGKRFGRLKTKLGYGEEHVFHSIRKTFITELENLGVAENVVADIVGHEKPRITYGLYSGGSSLKVKAEALSKLSYGKAD